MLGTVTRTPISPAPPMPVQASPATRWTLPELRDVLVAIGDREELATGDERTRLRRSRLRLEAELADLLGE
jgi:hypothetical protein